MHLAGGKNQRAIRLKAHRVPFDGDFSVSCQDDLLAFVEMRGVVTPPAAPPLDLGNLVRRGQKNSLEEFLEALRSFLAKLPTRASDRPVKVAARRAANQNKSLSLCVSCVSKPALRNSFLQKPILALNLKPS